MSVLQRHQHTLGPHHCVCSELCMHTQIHYTEETHTGRERRREQVRCSWGYVVWKAVDGVAAIASENQEFRIATGSTSRQLLIVRSAVEQLCTCTALLPPTGKKGAGNRWAPRWQCLQ
uniref:Uncharacterized protein n=3 Tax=Oryza TaxID=4527 RepID=A0A0D3EJ43_9ORYZ